MSKLIVSTEILEQLHCSVCGAHLSVFPIYIRNNGANPICGRCKIPNEDEFLRDEAYERIAQFIIFPCSQEKNGCPERLIPLQMKHHEKCCPYRKVNCPTKNLTLCNWQGPNKDLKQHFETLHSALLLNDRRFEVQFLSSIKENVLMPYEDELFIVSKEVDSMSGIFTCSVEHVIQSEEPKCYNYFVRVETSDSTYFHKFPEHSTSSNCEAKTKFSAEFIKEQLQNPAAIVACIEIVETGSKEDEPKVRIEVNKPDVDWELLCDLECPVCFDYMLPPIYQCLNGHSICATCKGKVELCPICRTEIRNTQNYILEKLTNRLIYPCKYYKMGCAVTLKSSDIRKHEDSCEYGPYDCPLGELENCKIKTTKNEVILHVEKTHQAYMLKSDKIHVCFKDIDGELEKYYIVKFANRIFKVCFKYENEQFYWAVQLVGPAEECKKFKFEIDLIDHSNRKLRQYVRGCCVPFGKQEDCFKTRGDYVIFLYEQIADFITENLSYRLRVVKV